MILLSVGCKFSNMCPHYLPTRIGMWLGEAWRHQLSHSCGVGCHCDWPVVSTISAGGSSQECLLILSHAMSMLNPKRQKGAILGPFILILLASWLALRPSFPPCPSLQQQLQIILSSIKERCMFIKLPTWTVFEHTRLRETKGLSQWILNLTHDGLLYCIMYYIFWEVPFSWKQKQCKLKLHWTSLGCDLVWFRLKWAGRLTAVVILGLHNTPLTITFLNSM